jgi:hypothetical protein
MIDLKLSIGSAAVRQRRAGVVPPPPPPPPTAVAAIGADGWSATYPSPPASFAPDSAPETVTLSRQGFDGAGQAVTVTEALTITRRVRQPFPNHSSLTADRVALSDYVLATDTIAGAVNNSAETSPKAVANHATPDRFVAGNLIGGDVQPIELLAFHYHARMGKQVAAAHCVISDGATSISVLVPNATVSNRAGDRAAVLVHRLPETDISALSNGLCWYDWDVLPHVGGAASVNRSGENGSGRREFTRRYFLKHPALQAAPPMAYVSTGGSDGSGVVSTSAATASASPFLTVLAAINAVHAAHGATTGVDGAIIRIGNDGGTPFVLQSTAATRTQRVAALTIERDPVLPRANARVSFGAAGFRPRLGGALAAPLATGALRFRDLAIVRTGALAIQGEAGAHLELIFESVDFDNGGHNAAWLSSSHDHHHGTSFTNLGGNSPLGPGTGEHRCLRGIAIDIAHGTIEGWLVTGCAIVRPGLMARGSRSQRIDRRVQHASGPDRVGGDDQYRRGCRHGRICAGAERDRIYVRDDAGAGPGFSRQCDRQLPQHPDREQHSDGRLHRGPLEHRL